MLLKTCVDNLPCKWNSIFSFQMHGQSIFFLQMSISVDRKAKTEGNLHQSDNVALGNTTN